MGPIVWAYVLNKSTYQNKHLVCLYDSNAMSDSSLAKDYEKLKADYDLLKIYNQELEDQNCRFRSGWYSWLMCLNLP